MCFISTQREEKGEAGERGGRFTTYNKNQVSLLSLQSQHCKEDQIKLGLNIDILVHRAGHLLKILPKIIFSSKCRFPGQKENNKLFESVHPKYWMIATAKVQKHDVSLRCWKDEILFFKPFKMTRNEPSSQNCF